MSETKKASVALVPAARQLLQRTPDFVALAPHFGDTEEARRYIWRNMVMLSWQLEQNTTLAAADPRSLEVAFSELVLLGLNLGAQHEACFVPYAGRAQMQLEYRGVVKLAKNGINNIVDIVSHNVYENDEFEVSYGTEQGIHHKPCLRGDRGNIYAAYTVIRVIDPKTKVIVPHFGLMTIEKIDAIMEKSKAYQAAVKYKKSEKSAWADPDFKPEMNKKTVLRNTLKIFPLSPALANAQEIEKAFEQDRKPILDVSQEQKEIIDKPQMLPASSTTEQVTAKLDADGDNVIDASYTGAGLITEKQAAELKKLEKNCQPDSLEDARSFLPTPDSEWSELEQAHFENVKATLTMNQKGRRGK
jgi:recombination protein RecT